MKKTVRLQQRGMMMSRESRILLVLLLAGAAMGNHLMLPLYFKLDLLFGSICTMIIIQIFGWRWGILSAVLSSAYAWVALNHHFSGVNFICEAAFVGYLLHKKGRGVVFLSSTYWVLLGMPMAWLYFHLRMPGTGLALPGMAMQGTMHGIDTIDRCLPLLIMLKQGINGIFNALVAQFLVNLFPLSPRLVRISGRRQVSFQPLVSTILAACVLFPLLTLTILSIREEFRQEMDDLSIQELGHVTSHTQDTVRSWLGERLTDFTSLAKLQGSVSTAGGIGSNVSQINELDRNILQIGLVDANGFTYAFDPPVDPVSHRPNIGIKVADEAMLQSIRGLRAPRLSEVKANPAAGQAPIVAVDVPVVAADGYKGYVTGVVDLQGISDLLVQVARDWSCRAVVLDSSRRIIARSDSSWPLLEPLKLQQGQMVRLSSTTYQWTPHGPGEEDPSARWLNSFYIKEIPLGLDTSWRVVVEVPLAPRLHSLNLLFIKELGFMMLMTLLTLVFSHFIGKRLVLSLSSLRDATTALPDMVSTKKAIAWPASYITEINALITNFQSITASLAKKFDELAAKNEDLHHENGERRKTEEKLAQAVAELTALFQAFPDLCLVADRETTVLDCRGGSTVHGVSCEAADLLGRRLASFFPAEVAARYADAVADALETGGTVTFEYKIPRGDGEDTLETRLIPLSREQVIIIVRDVTDLKKAGELKVANEQLRHLSMYLEDARENERMRIAREIHDELGQQLTALRFDVGWIGKKLGEGQEAVAQRIGSMGTLLDGTIKSIQRIVRELRPRLLDDLGLVAAMEWQVSEFTKRTGIACDLQIEPGDLVVERKRGTTLYRILQEALTNIIRHAQATMVTVSLQEENNCLLLQVRDNGKGISESQAKGGSSFGMFGMLERAREWNGIVTVMGEPGMGTTISVRIPLEDTEDAYVQSTDMR